jgi:hypothetical protein
MTRPTRVSALVCGALLALAVGASACKGERGSELTMAYGAAACVSPVVAVGVQPPSRQWDRPIELRDGRRVVVLGLHAPGGAIALRYPGAAQPTVAADAGDYVYPSDVRWDRERDRLYVKAQGITAAGGERTVVFEYDLASRREVRREAVDSSRLPAECPTEQATGK